jgi:hypothetical protein
VTEDDLRRDRDRLLVMLCDWANAEVINHRAGCVPVPVVLELRDRLGDVTDARDRLAQGEK